MLVWIARNVSIPVMRLLGGASAFARFSVGEASLFIAIAFILCKCVFALIRHSREAAISLARSSAVVVGAFFVIYALVWLPLAGTSRLEAPSVASDPARVYQLCRELVEKANVQYKYYEIVPDEVTERVVSAMHRLTGREPVIKASMNPWWMKRLSLAGVCLPWSGEALVRLDMPKIALPFVMAHEGAHQIGFGPEAEANYVAYRALESDERLGYSATMYAIYYSLDELRRLSNAGFGDIISSMDDRVFSDYATLAAFSRGKTGAQGGVAEAFLKLSGQSGLDSYRQIVDYLISLTLIK